MNGKLQLLRQLILCVLDVSALQQKVALPDPINMVSLGHLDGRIQREEVGRTPQHCVKRLCGKVPGCYHCNLSSEPLRTSCGCPRLTPAALGGMSRIII